MRLPSTSSAWSVPPRSRPPGEAFAYRNAALALAGRVIEKLMGTAYEQAIAELLFEPLRPLLHPNQPRPSEFVRFPATWTLCAWLSRADTNLIQSIGRPEMRLCAAVLFGMFVLCPAAAATHSSAGPPPRVSYEAAAVTPTTGELLP